MPGLMASEGMFSPTVGLADVTDIALSLEVFGLNMSSSQRHCGPASVAIQTDHPSSTSFYPLQPILTSLIKGLGDIHLAS